MRSIFDDPEFMRSIWHLIPSITIITDDDVRVLTRNEAAKALIKKERSYMTRAGDLMNCINAAGHPGGCGKGQACKDCVVRNSVNSAYAGKPVHRAPGEVQVTGPGGRTITTHVLVSASVARYNGKDRAVVVLEDISELAELRSLLPICCICKKIRTEEGKWEGVDSYLKKHSPDLSLSHGICPECAVREYPELAVRKSGRNASSRKPVRAALPRPKKPS